MLQVDCADLSTCESIWVCHGLFENRVPHAIRWLIIAVQFSTHRDSGECQSRVNWPRAHTLFTQARAFYFHHIWDADPNGRVETTSRLALNNNFLQAISRSLREAFLGLVFEESVLTV